MTVIADKIYEIVKDIPRGKVMTYGQVAERVGNKRLSRVVGNVLHKNPDPANIPCHRVVNSKGELSESFAFGGAEAQRQLLEKEGVKIKLMINLSLKAMYHILNGKKVKLIIKKLKFQ